MSNPRRSGPVAPLREFDGFELIRPLGSGGMGTVYLARELALERLVAIKFITSQESQARARLVREAKAIARLQHPNIVAIYRVGSLHEQPYIAYEFVEGRQLDALPRPLEWPQVVQIGVGILRGLAAAHRRGVLHRDIKPSNVMLTSSNEVKLLDFGLATWTELGAEAELPMHTEATDPAFRPDVAIDPRASVGMRVTRNLGIAQQHSLAPNRLTRQGALIGTPLFMAPELWEGVSASRQSDLYAVGLVLFDLLVGSLPHADVSIPDLVECLTKAEPPSIAQVLPGLPRPLSSLVDSLLKRRPEDRPASTEAVRDQLEALAHLYLPFTNAGQEQPDSDANRIRASFLRATRHGDALGEHFYERVFALEPKLRSIFPTDLSAQKRMIIAALKLTIDNLRHPERLLPFLEELGRRHAGYGVEPSYLGIMGQALLDALAALDEEWDDNIAQVWSMAYAHIAKIMQRAMTTPKDNPQHLPGVLSRAYWEMPLPSPRTEWISIDEGDVAFQRFGHGAVELVIVGEWLTHTDQSWEQPLYARFLRKLASLSRVILFDRRGCGMSSRRRRPMLEKQVDDIGAVLDANRIERAVLIGIGDGGTAAALFAATRPERARGLVLYGYGRCLAEGGDDLTREAMALKRQLEAVRTGWGGSLFLDTLAPSLADDLAYQKWWSSYLRHAAAPSEAAALLTLSAQASARAVLQTIHTPTLILHREADRHRSIADSREAARLIPDSRHVVLPGADHHVWAGNTDDVLGALHWFLSTLPNHSSSGTIAACVLAVTAIGAEPPDALWSAASTTLLQHGGVSMDVSSVLFETRPLSTSSTKSQSRDRTILAYFDGAARTLRCAMELIACATRLGVTVAAAVDAGGLTVLPTLRGSVVDRVLDLVDKAVPGEVLLTHAVCELSAGGGLNFLPHAPLRIGDEELVLFSLPALVPFEPPAKV